MKLSLKRTFVVGGSIVALVSAGAVPLLVSRPTPATTKFAAETGQPCAACHVRPDGGPELTPYGKKFKANGNKVPRAMLESHFIG